MGQLRITPLLTAPQSAQPPYQLLVANFSKPHTPEFGTTGSNPIRTRSGFEWQNTSFLSYGQDAARNTVVGTGTGSLLTNPPWTNQTGSVTINDNDFTTGRAFVFIGRYVLEAGEDFAIGGAVGATATNLALAISRLTGYTATPAGAVVNVVGPLGSQRLTWRTQVFGTKANFSAITPDSGFLAPGDPQRGGNVILPP